MARPGDFLDLLAVYLEANGVTNVKTGVYPAEPIECTALLGLPGSTIGASRDVAGLQFPRFQAIIRSAVYDTASDQHQLVRELLHGKIGLILPVGANAEDPAVPYVRILRLHSDQEGGPIGDDDNGRYEFSINFTAEFHNVST